MKFEQNEKKILEVLSFSIISKNFKIIYSATSEKCKKKGKNKMKEKNTTNTTMSSVGNGRT